MRERLFNILRGKRAGSLYSAIKSFFFFFSQEPEKNNTQPQNQELQSAINPDQAQESQPNQSIKQEAAEENNNVSRRVKAWAYTKKAFLVTKDVVTSTSFGRVVLIGSAALLFATAPVAPWVAGIGLTAAVGSVAAGLTIETTRRYRLNNLQKEDKLLNKLAKLEVEKNRNLEQFREKSSEIDPSQRKNYDTLLAALENSYRKFSPYDPERYKAGLLKAIAKVGVFTAPENFANIGVSLIMLDPLSISFTVGTTLLTYNEEIKKAKKYNTDKATLLNDMEAAKSVLNLNFESSKGLSILKDVANLRLAEAIATKEVMQEVGPGKEINPEKLMVKFNETRDLLISEFSKKDNIFTKKGENTLKQLETRRDEISRNPDIPNKPEILNNLNNEIERTKQLADLKERHKEYLTDKGVEEQETLQQKAGNFFKTMGKVVWYGFSVKKTEEMFSPVRKHENYLGDLESIQKAKTREHEIEKSKQLNKGEENVHMPNHWVNAIKPSNMSHRQNRSNTL